MKINKKISDFSKRNSHVSPNEVSLLRGNFSFLKRKSLNKKGSALTQIFLITLSIFAFTFLMSDKTIVQAASSGATFCCQEVASSAGGGSCLNMPLQTDCVVNADTSAAPTYCESTSYCKTGTCYDSSEGICMTSPRTICEGEKGMDWIDKPMSEVPQCQLGCCILADEAAFVTLTRCKNLSSTYHLENDFRTDITNELDCIATAQSQEMGACTYVSEFERLCDLTTRSECGATSEGTIDDEGNILTSDEKKFYPGFLCSAEVLATSCAKEISTGCYQGDVYWYDSCGNRENVYYGDREIYNTHNGGKIATARELKIPESDGTNKNNGNCDYLSGTRCAAYEERIGGPIDSDYYCRSNDCGIVDGKTRVNGEAWCHVDGNLDDAIKESKDGSDIVKENNIVNVYGDDDYGLLGDGKDPAGSRYYRKVCIDGEVVTEPCADYRNEICIEGHIDVGDDNGVEDDNDFSTAACRTNKWQDCLLIENEDDCEDTGQRNCAWIDESITGLLLGIDPGEVTEETYSNRPEGICVAAYPVGLDFWEKGNAEKVCGQVNAKCIVKYERKGSEMALDFLSQDKSFTEDNIVSGGDCLTESWAIEMNKICASLGDCGGHVNYAGIYTDDGYTWRVPKWNETKEEDIVDNLLDLFDETGKWEIINKKLLDVTDATTITGAAIAPITGNAISPITGMAVQYIKDNAFYLFDANDESIHYNYAVWNYDGKKVISHYGEDTSSTVYIRNSDGKWGYVRGGDFIVLSGTDNSYVQTFFDEAIEDDRIKETILTDPAKISNYDAAKKALSQTQTEDPAEVDGVAGEVTVGKEGVLINDPYEDIAHKDIAELFMARLGLATSLPTRSDAPSVTEEEEEESGEGDKAVPDEGVRKVLENGQPGYSDDCKKTPDNCKEGICITMSGKDVCYKSNVNEDEACGEYAKCKTGLECDDGVCIDESKEGNNFNQPCKTDTDCKSGKCGKDEKCKSAFGDKATPWLKDLGLDLASILGAYKLAQEIGPMLGLTSDETSDLSEIAAWATGAGQVTETILKNTGLMNEGGSALVGLGVGALVGIIAFGELYRDQETQVVEFYCQPWQAPSGGDNCELCNKGAGCSEYKCKSLGLNCDLVNVGTEDEMCVDTNPDDTNPPVITPNEDFLPIGSYSYSNVSSSPPSPGFRIDYENPRGGNCIKPYTPITFGVTVDEPAQCKIDTKITSDYDSMTVYFGGSNMYDYNHTEILSLPSAKDLEKSSSIKLENGKDLTLYMRCKDASGNTNDAEYAIQLCVDDSPDTTAPIVYGASVDNGQCIAQGKSFLDVKFYTNEPAVCKWSHQDQDFNSMSGTMRSCKHEEAGGLSYSCRANLTGVDIDGTEFFIKCQDTVEPGMTNNTMAESYKFSLHGSTGLLMMDFQPNGSETIYGGVSPMPIELYVETAMGCSAGLATCLFSIDNESFSEFSDTYNVDGIHTQTLYLEDGEQDLYVKCIDDGGNEIRNHKKINLEINENAPIVTRFYQEDGMLKIITLRDSECSYSFNDCDFLFEDGIEMPYANQTIHVAEWSSDKTFYIKCRDEFRFDENVCSVIIKPTKNFL